MTFQNETLNFLALIDKDFENVQDTLITKLGDKGNDIGDAGNALELISNQISENPVDHNHEMLRYYLAKLTGINQHKIKHIMLYLAMLAEKYPDQLTKLRTQYQLQSA